MSKPKKRRHEKGLFGLPRKKSILFTFQPREGEECSSDSEDSDYLPGRNSPDEDSDLPLNKVKRSIPKTKTLKRNGSQKKQTRAGKSSDDKSNTLNKSGNATALCLPDEILLKIFEYCVYKEGVVKFLPKVSRVCKDWYRVSQDPLLLERLDLSAAQLQLTKVLPKGLLQRDLSVCKFLSLSGQTKLPSSLIQSLLTITIGLISLDIFNCPTVKPDLVKRLPQLCPCLSRVDMSYPREFNTSITFSSIEVLITSCGSRLLELRLARILAVRTNIKSFFKLLQENCPNLEELDVRMNPYFQYADTPACNVDIGSFIKGCPKVKELRLDGLNICDNLAENVPYEPSLKKLKIFSQSSVVCDASVQPIYYLMFGPDSKLSELNLSSSSFVPDNLTSWVKQVECCYLADMKWKHPDSWVMQDCLALWSSSIRVLDLSYNKLDNLLDSALSIYKEHQEGGYPLEVLNLSNTNVKPGTVRKLLISCKRLERIDLTACRELPRGSKRIFNKKELGKLLKMLSPGKNLNSDTEEEQQEASESSSSD